MPSDSGSPIILIGGPSTTGKSTLARALGRLIDARVVDADLLWMAIQRVQPLDHDIHLLHAHDVWALDAEELLDRYLRVSGVVCQAIEAVVLHYASQGVAGVIEGCWILPELAVRKDYAGHAIQAPVKALYLRESSLDQLSDQLMMRDDGWHASQPEAFRDAHALMQWQFGLEVNRCAENLGLPIIDSRPLDTLLERALTALDLSSGLARA